MIIIIVGVAVNLPYRDDNSTARYAVHFLTPLSYLWLIHIKT